MSRTVGKCPNCGSVIEDDVIKLQAQSEGLGHQLYAVSTIIDISTKDVETQLIASLRRFSGNT